MVDLCINTQTNVIMYTKCEGYTVENKRLTQLLEV